MTTADMGNMLIELELPREIRNKFGKHYIKAPEVRILDDGSCSRCGVEVQAQNERRHATWHRNTSCKLWLAGEFALQHMKEHVELGHAIGAVIEAMDLTQFAVEDNEGDVIMGDGVPVAHVHEEGTAHEH